MLLARILLWDVPLPTKTLIVESTGDVQVATGESLTIRAKVSGVIPPSGRIEILSPGRPRRIQLLTPMTASRDTFVTTVENVQEPFSYTIYLNDARSGPHHAGVTDPPGISSVEFRQIYPDYTGLEPVERLPGTMDLLAGSTLEIRGVSTQDLSSARVIVPGKEPLDMAVSKNEFSGNLVIPAADMEGFSIELKNRPGIASRDNTFYRVNVMKDEPPQIVWDPLQPERRTLTRESTPKVSFAVRDDFALNTLDLLIAPEGDEDKAVRLPLQNPAGEKSLEVDHEITEPGKVLPWKEGAGFVYWIEASDGNIATGPGIARSTPREWLVVTKEEKRRELQERMENQARILRELSNQQEKLREQLGESLK